MKKITFSIILINLFISFVKADTTFNIDMDKIDILSKSTKLIENLDANYKIETNDFKKTTTATEDLKELTKKLVSLTFSNKTVQEKLKDFVPYTYISQTDGFQTLTSSLMIETFLKDIEKNKISYNYIKSIRIVPFEKGILSFVYLPDIKINNKQKEVVLAYWLKETTDGYKLHFPWYNIDDNLEDYFNKVAKEEEAGNTIGSTYKSLTLGETKKQTSSNEMSEIYQNNVNSAVQITAMNDGGVASYGSGFIIKEGIVATTWSLFLQFLSNSNYIYVNDNSNNTYDIQGIIAANTEYDIVILKLNKEMGKRVTFGNTNDLKLDDKLFMINSKENSNFSINYGSFVTLENGRLKNLFALNESDVGAALYNKEGQVVAFNTSEVLNSELSYANSTEYLKKLQNNLLNKNFSDINATSIEIFKQNYYNNLKEEKKYYNISDSKLDNYLKIGDLKNLITLDLVKASYKDKILSLRYKNNISNTLDTMYFTLDFINNLTENGYKETLTNKDKRIFVSNQYKIIIKEDLNYLIIIIMEN